MIQRIYVTKMLTTATEIFPERIRKNFLAIIGRADFMAAITEMESFWITLTLIICRKVDPRNMKNRNAEIPKKLLMLIRILPAVTPRKAAIR